MISVVGTALVFAVSLVVTGISDAFASEVDHTFDSLDVSAFVVPDGVSGPITGGNPFDPAELPDGVVPMAYLVQTANPADPEMVAVLGLPPGDAEPEVSAGRQLRSPDDAIVGAAAGFPVGSEIEVSGRQLTVVGTVEHLSVNAGMPMVVIPLETFQTTLLGGLPLVTAGIAQPGAVAPEGFHLVDRRAAREDALRILGDAASTIALVKVLLWIVAALIVGSVLYVSVIERTRDFAVFGAIGATRWPVAGGIALQAGVISVASAVFGIALAFVLAPMFAMPVDLSVVALIGLPFIALAVGLVAGAFALRRATAIDPALALGGAR